jgi:hypothetical protein
VIGDRVIPCPPPHNTVREQPAPNVAAADVDRVVGRDYPAEQRSEVLGILQQYGIEKWHPEVDLVRLAVLKLAAGNVTQLHSHMEIAKIDYRDVLAAAEYPGYMKRDSVIDSLSPEERAEIIEDDWKQYQVWLLK